MNENSEKPKYEPQLGRYELGNVSSRDYDRNAKLWRYFTFEKFYWLLEKSSLWHSRLDQLDDPFEGSFPHGYLKQRDAGQLPPHLQSGFPPERDKEWNKRVRTSCFVTCWHESQYESEAMWNLYCPKGAGVAIVSTPIRMHDSVDLRPYSGLLGPVEYKDFETDDMILRPLPKSFGRTAHPAMLKRKSFAYENEYRGLVQFPDPAGTTPPMPPEYVHPIGISTKVDLKGLIQEIWINPTAAGYYLDIVKSAAARHGLTDLVRISKLVPAW